LHKIYITFFRYIFQEKKTISSGLFSIFIFFSI